MLGLADQRRKVEQQRGSRRLERGVLHTAAYWLLHTLRGLAPKASVWRDAQFDTLRLAFVKIAARVTELFTRIKISLPSSYLDKASFARLAGRALALPRSYHSLRGPRRRSGPRDWTA